MNWIIFTDMHITDYVSHHALNQMIWCFHVDHEDPVYQAIENVHCILFEEHPVFSNSDKT